MNNQRDYEYMNEELIDEEFKCSICNQPFEKATCTPCDHTFCRSCIELWLKNNTNENNGCPICRCTLSINDDLKPASRIISNRIDRYLVKCLACQQDKILRGSFEEHVSKVCMQMKVGCIASDVSCTWEGPRSALNDHLNTCSYQQIRPVLQTILAKNNSLEQLLIDQQKEIKNINERYQTQERQINQLTKQIESFVLGDKNTIIKRTLTFNGVLDEIFNCNEYCPMSPDYAGFDWYNAAFMPRKHGETSYPNTGFATAFKSSQIKGVGFNFGSLPIRFRDCRNSFCIVSFEATCAFQDEVILTIVGRRNDKLKYTTVFVLHYQELKEFRLNWNDINELEFSPAGGRQLITSRDTDRHVVLTCLNFG